MKQARQATEKKRKKASGGKSISPPGIAPGQALGYSVQYTRLVAMLLDAPAGSFCSLEVLDDISQELATGETKLVQTKSALTANPVADRAVPMWKALFNWLQLAKGGFVDPRKTTFELYVSRQVEGGLIDGFHTARLENEAKAAVQKAREMLWGLPPECADKKRLPEELSRYANPVLEAAEDVLLPIIVNLRLSCGSGSPQRDIEAAFRRAPVSQSRVFDIADKMCGWVKRKVDERLEKQAPAVISQEDFHREYVAYVRSVDREMILKSFARRPSESEKLEHLPDVFIQQLSLIELSYDEKLAAVSDYLRASWDRMAWSKRGDVHEESFVQLNDALTRAWSNLSKVVQLEGAGKPDLERGQLLHLRCMMHQAKLQGMDVPSHFVPGCFHYLSDDLVIGWHPEYRRRIKKLASVE